MTTTNDIPQDQLERLLAAIALIKQERSPELVTPRYHEINCSTFFLDRDGSVTIDERENGGELVKLTGKEAYGLLTFLRLPGVAHLIEQADAAEQHRMWHDYESDKVQELTDEQAYERVMDNPMLRSRIHERLVDAGMELLKERLRLATA